jgi:hypothetical protein
MTTRPIAADTSPPPPVAGACLPGELALLNPLVVEGLARYGRGGDGGYILPTLRLKSIDALLSFGIFDNWALDEDVWQMNPDLLIHAYDHTIGKRRFGEYVMLDLARCALGRSSFALVKRRIATYRAYNRFFVGNRKHFPQRVFNRKDEAFDATIDEVFGRIEGRNHVFVKMDIEGGEYRVIPDLLRYADRIELMAIEFHDSMPLRDTFVRLIKEILREFEIVHLHGNNFGGVAPDGLPDTLEATFVHRRLVPVGGRRRDRLPVQGLDAPNHPARPDLPLHFC